MKRSQNSGGSRRDCSLRTFMEFAHRTLRWLELERSRASFVGGRHRLRAPWTNAPRSAEQARQRLVAADEADPETLRARARSAKPRSLPRWCAIERDRIDHRRSLMMRRAPAAGSRSPIRKSKSDQQRGRSAGRSALRARGKHCRVAGRQRWFVFDGLEPERDWPAPLRRAFFASSASASATVPGPVGVLNACAIARGP
jgi:hypothetical protein